MCTKSKSYLPFSPLSPPVQPTEPPFSPLNPYLITPQHRSNGMKSNEKHPPQTGNENSGPSPSSTGNAVEVIPPATQSTQPSLSSSNMPVPPQGNSLKGLANWKAAAEPHLKYWAKRVTTILQDADRGDIPTDVTSWARLTLNYLEALLSVHDSEENRMAVLTALELHFPRAELKEGDNKVFWKHMLDDTADIPPMVLAVAAQNYRNDPDAQYYPRAGQLRKALGDFWTELEAMRRMATLIKNFTPSDVLQRITPERMREIKEEEAERKRNDRTS